jgi:hypothetical protein
MSRKHSVNEKKTKRAWHSSALPGAASTSPGSSGQALTNMQKFKLQPGPQKNVNVEILLLHLALLYYKPIAARTAFI